MPPAGMIEAVRVQRFTELEAVAPRENHDVGGSIQRYLWAFSAVISDFVCVLDRHRCGLRGLDQLSQISCQISSPLHIPFQERLGFRLVADLGVPRSSVTVLPRRVADVR